eukprot:COSAG06_NODE_7841_length_2358_cov_1.149624_4_plen_96_part_01
MQWDKASETELTETTDSWVSVSSKRKKKTLQRHAAALLLSSSSDVESKGPEEWQQSSWSDTVIVTESITVPTATTRVLVGAGGSNIVALEEQSCCS